MTVGSGRLRADDWEDVGVKFNIIWKLEYDILVIILFVG